MKKANKDEMPEEIDFSSAVRNKYAARIALRSNIVTIKPEIFAAFPSERAVNDALARLIRTGKQDGARASRRRPASPAAPPAVQSVRSR